MDAVMGYARWAMIGWGCFLAFFGYLYVVSELLEEPGVLSRLAHGVGIGIVGLGCYSAYRSLRSGRVMESEQTRSARAELARLRRTGGRTPKPVGDVALPLVVDARPKLVDDRAKNPVTWLVAVALIALLAWPMSEDLDWSFMLTFLGIVVGVTAVVGLAYATNQRGRIVVDETRVRARTFLRTRHVDRAVLVDAVEVTMQIHTPRGPDARIASVYVTRQGGRRAFSMGRHVYDGAGVDAVLGVLQLPLHQVAGSHDPVSVEAFVPGSTSFAQRRPFTLGLAIAAGLIAACAVVVIAVVAYDEWDDERGGGQANRSSVYLEQTLTVDGVSGSIYRNIPGLGEQERKMLLFGIDALDAHPERGCRLRDVVSDTACSVLGTEGFVRRARELSRVSGNVLVSRSNASETHDVTLLEFRREGQARVLALSVVDDGGEPYGLEVAFLDTRELEEDFRPAIDDIRCTGRPGTSVHVAARFDTCR